MRTTIIDKTNLPKFKLFTELEPGKEYDQFTKAVQSKHIEEMISMNTLYGELSPMITDTYKALNIDLSKATHTIRAVTIKETGVEFECELMDTGHKDLMGSFILNGIIRFSPRLLAGTEVFHFITMDAHSNPTNIQSKIDNKNKNKELIKKDIIEKRDEYMAELAEDTKHANSCFIQAVYDAYDKYPELSIYFDGEDLVTDILDRYKEQLARDIEKGLSGVILIYINDWISTQIIDRLVDISLLYKMGEDDKTSMEVLSMEYEFYKTIRELYNLKLMKLEREEQKNDDGLHTIIKSQKGIVLPFKKH